MVASIGTVNASWTSRGAKGKTANDTAFKTLDADAQAALKEAVGGRAYNSAKKISASLNADGVKTTVGKGSNGETFIDITNKNGSKTRIWDVGGDSGIGTQDLSFTDAVNSVGNDLAKNVQNGIDPSNSLLVNQVTSTDNQDSVADKKLFSNTENKTTTTSDADKAAEEQKLLNRIAADLMDELNISEEEALKKAPDYVALYTANSIA
jgi:hypothetical protein